jgi:hypothetical protein
VRYRHAHTVDIPVSTVKIASEVAAVSRRGNKLRMHRRLLAGVANVDVELAPRFFVHRESAL